MVGRDVGAALAARLGADSVRIVDENEVATLTAAEYLADVDRVLYAPAPLTTDEIFGAAAGYRIFGVARSLVSALHGLDSPPRLHLLTRNAQPISEGDRAAAAQAVLWGLGRSLALEHPEFWGSVVDIDESVPLTLAAGYLVAETTETTAVSYTHLTLPTKRIV